MLLYLLGLSWRNLRANPVQAVIPALIVALAVGSAIVVFALGDAARAGIVQASDPFGVLVIGPKGDGQALVLNAVLLQGQPTGVIPYRLYDALRNDPRVRLAVPLAASDNVGGAPIVGTDANFFQLRRTANSPPAFQVADGRLFERDFEAVLGSAAASAIALQPGQQFTSTHGTGRGIASDQHQQVYTVVGLLASSGTPYDRAVFTTFNSIWQVHEEEDADRPSAAEIGGVEFDQNLTAILALPTGFIEQNELQREFYLGTEAQAAAPGAELAGVFDLFRQVEQALGAVGVLILLVAALTVFLALYALTVARRREIAIMRSLGGGRGDIFALILIESVAIVLFGALLGRVVGYGVGAGIAAALSAQSAIPMQIQFLADLEPMLLLLPLLAGVVAGLIPAAMAYSVDVVEQLFPG